MSHTQKRGSIAKVTYFPEACKQLLQNHGKQQGYPCQFLLSFEELQNWSWKKCGATDPPPPTAWYTSGVEPSIIPVMSIGINSENWYPRKRSTNSIVHWSETGGEVAPLCIKQDNCAARGFIQFIQPPHQTVLVF
jgi:hypothetical protein